MAENLQQHFDSFINQDNELAFFTGLYDYVTYILETPTLKKIIDKIMDEKDIKYKKLEQLENQALEELKAAKEKLLKIMADNQIDPTSLEHIVTRHIQGGSNSLLGDLKELESRETTINKLRSDYLDRYLFDIALNIYQQKPDCIKEFIISGEIPEDSYANDIFTFSKTVGSTRRQVELIKQTQQLELWGTVDHLLKAQIAFHERCKNSSPREVVEKYANQKRASLGNKDFSDIDLGIIDMVNFVANQDKRLPNQDPYYLKPPNFKRYATRVNTYLIKKLSEDGAGTKGVKKNKSEILELHLDSVGNLWREPKTKYCYSMNEESDRYKILCYLAKNRDYNKTSTISLELEGKTKQLIRTEIGQIKKNISKKLNIPGNSVIEAGKRGSGYRINPECKIEIKSK